MTLTAERNPDLRDMLENVEVIVGIEFGNRRVAFLSIAELWIIHFHVGNDL